MKKVVLFLIMGLGLRLVLSPLIYSGDVNNHVGWGKSILQAGSVGAYDREYTGILQPTYPPLALFSFVTSYWLHGTIISITNSLNHTISVFPSGLIWLLEDQDVQPAFFKVISIISDLGISILIYLIARKLMSVSSQAASLASLVYLFNPAVWYNSALWGQLESPPLLFILLAIWLIIKNRPTLSHAAFAAAMLFKQSSLIFLPAFLIYSHKQIGFKKTLTGLFIQFLVFYLSYLPFFNFKLSTINYPLVTYLHRIEVGSGSNYISDHAFNLWAAFTHDQKIPDTMIVFQGLSANQLGKIGFLIISGLLTLPYIVSRRKSPVIQLLGLTSFTAFMVLTRMHERYLAPALPFMTISAASLPQLWPIYFLLSVGHLFNMYHNWWYPTLSWLRPVTDNWTSVVVVILLFIVSIISWMATYFDVLKKSKS